MRRETELKNLAVSALLLAASVVLPFAGGVLPLGDRLLLAQIPVLLCGLVCGAPYGAAVGLLAPFLSFVVTGAPAIYPDAVAMAVEYALFGAVASPIFRAFARSAASLYASLIAAMAAGRVGYIAASYIMLELQKQPYSLSAIVRQECVACWPGLLLQLLAVPALVLAADRTGLMDEV
ncbi:MAG: ECF transporter S component [Oscillospiraceae bacterium]